MDRNELIEKIASEMLEGVVQEVENQPLAKFASEEGKIQVVADKLAEIHNEQELVKQAAEETFEDATAQEDLAVAALEELGYEVPDEADFDAEDGGETSEEEA